MSLMGVTPSLALQLGIKDSVNVSIDQQVRCKFPTLLGQFTLFSQDM